MHSFGWVKNLFFCIFVSIVHHVASISKLYGQKLNFDGFHTESGLGPQMCISECQAVGKCWTVNYNLDHLSCEMNIDADQSNLVNNADFVFVDIDSADKDCGSVICEETQVCVEFKDNSKRCIHASSGQGSCYTETYIGSEASLTWSSLYPGYENPALDGSSAWSPADNLQNTDQWLQFEFPSSRKFTGVTTKGLKNVNHYVTSYQIEYQTSSTASWQVIQDQNNQNRVFQGNVDDSNAVSHYFDQTIQATSLKLKPLTWNEHICIRIDFLGC